MGGQGKLRRISDGAFEEGCGQQRDVGFCEAGERTLLACILGP
jgi:hypothetical protein